MNRLAVVDDDPQNGTCVVFRNLRSTGTVVYDITLSYDGEEWIDRITLKVLDFPYTNFKAKLELDAFTWPDFNTDLFIPYPTLSADENFRDQFSYALNIPEQISDGYWIEYNNEREGYRLSFGLNQGKDTVFDGTIDVSLNNYTVSVPFTVTIGDGVPLIVTSFTADKTQVHTGDSVTFSVTTTGENGTVSLQLEVDGEDEFCETLPAAIGKACVYQFMQPGTYEVYGYVEDETWQCETIEDPIVIEVTDPLVISGVIANGPELLTGDELIWTISHTGGKGAVTYDYTVSQDGEVVESETDITDPAISYVPMTPGSYTLAFTARDENGETVARSKQAGQRHPARYSARYWRPCENTGLT